MKIYIITKGEYSDYHICAATTDENTANNLLLLYRDKWDEPQIEIYDDESAKDVMQGYSVWDVFICSKNMAFRACGRYRDIEIPDNINQVERTEYWYLCDENEDYTISVIAKSKEHAIKIAQDKFAEYKYNEQG